MTTACSCSSGYSFWPQIYFLATRYSISFFDLYLRILFYCFPLMPVLSLISIQDWRFYYHSSSMSLFVLGHLACCFAISTQMTYHHWLLEVFWLVEVCHQFHFLLSASLSARFRQILMELENHFSDLIALGQGLPPTQVLEPPNH